ncbi:MAG: DUF4837 family protein, partial [Cyclobacteriaceae bacterium]
SCDSTNKENLPPASGISGDMYVVMDSTQWKGDLGAVIDSLFRTEMQGLPRKESIYKLRWIDPRKFNFVLKQRRNLIFAFTLDQNTQGARIIRNLFTPESLSKIKNDPTSYVLTRPDVYANGQEAMYLFGNTEKDLIENVRSKGHLLVEYFNRAERERLAVSLFKAGQVKGISEWLQKNLDCSIKIPFGYKLVENNNEFLWVRQINPADDKDIFISKTDYYSKDQFTKENLIAHRDQFCKKYLFEDPEVSNSYLTTETTIPFIPVTTKEVQLNKHYAVELRGLWRTNNFTMGGPFVGYALVDEEKGKFYYIEGFTYSPSKDQREIIRELETILSTFRTSESLTASK